MNKYGLESKSKVKKTSATKYFSGEEKKEKKKPTPKAKSKPKAKPKKKPSPKAKPKPVHTFFTDDEEEKPIQNKNFFFNILNVFLFQNMMIIKIYDYFLIKLNYFSFF